MTDPLVGALAGLEPAPLWRYFLGLSAIPRPSGRERDAALWVAAQARALGCEVEMDAVGNVLARKAASPGREDRPPVALQCHIDMVCEKNEGTTHDFTRDPIRIRRDGEVIRATGTTLGADNGIGVATALAVLAGVDLVHPPVEALFTVDEESGLTGVGHLAPGWLRAPRLLNLDSEEEGELTIGCAGGVDTTASRTLTFSAPPPGSVALSIKVSGLKGGHSGVDIELGRANALRLLGQILEVALRSHDVTLGRVTGGNQRNAIPREAHAVVCCAPGRVQVLRLEVARLADEARLAFGAFDPGITVGVAPTTCDRVMRDADARALVGLLLAGPHGVEAMSPDIPGLVQTSTNMGVLEMEEGRVSVNFMTRSSIDPSRRALTARIHVVCTLCGFDAEDSGAYPGWKPHPDAAVVRLVDDVHREVYGKPMVIKAIHAGLECGLIAEKYPTMEMASFGPAMGDVHTPDEYLSIPSVANFWRLLVAVLARM